MRLDRRGILISAVTGFVAGLGAAWLLWQEAPPPREVVSSPVRVASTDLYVGPSPATTETVEAAPPEEAPPRLPTESLNIADANLVEGRLVQDLGNGQKVEFTVVPAVQNRAKSVLEQAEVPFGALVAMEPGTGRILGHVEHSTTMPELQNLAGLSTPPAASVFKVITAAALLEQAQLPADFEVCFHGGQRGFNLQHLDDNARTDTTCRTLTEALARSSNVIFGKLADRHLKPQTLDRYADAFAWRREIPFVLPVEVSGASFSDDRLTFARTAAGFYHTHLSPIHGALVASAVGNGGVMMAPKLVERFTVDDTPVMVRQSATMGRAIQPRTARILSEMMVQTTEMGTARAYFSRRDRWLRGVRVAAKTGSLSANAANGERHHFSWWIGFAPAENPRIAVAALVVNVGAWRIKSTYLAREVMEAYFKAVHNEEISASR